MDPDSQQTGTAKTAALPAITIICRTPHSLVPLIVIINIINNVKHNDLHEVTQHWMMQKEHSI
jgi:hypothetical protein